MSNHSLKAMIGSDLNFAASLLADGEVVAIPTETVYGLAGNAFNENAIKKIYAVKSRPLYNPLIVHVAAIDRITAIAQNIPSVAWKLLETFSPGPLTVLLHKKQVIADIVTAGLEKVAVRIPHHKLTLELLQKIDFPLAAPSANPFGYISPTTAAHVMKQLGEKIPYILDGGVCDKGIESTVIGFENDMPIIYRLGAVSIEDIKEIAPDIIVKTAVSEKPFSPGMLMHHYSPVTKLLLTAFPGEVSKQFLPEDVAVIVFTCYLPDIPESNQYILSTSGNLEEAAKNLYAALHILDEKKLKVIIAERLPDQGIGAAINDRLQKAAAK